MYGAKVTKKSLSTPPERLNFVNKLSPPLSRTKTRGERMTMARAVCMQMNEMAKKLTDRNGR